MDSSTNSPSTNPPACPPPTHSTSPSNPITFRPRQPTDIPSLLKILTSVYDLTGYPVSGPSIFTQKLSSPHSIRSTVALFSDRLAGHIELEPANTLSAPILSTICSPETPLSTFLCLTSLFVDPAVQGKGIGAALVRDAMMWAKREGKRLVLVVLEKDGKACRLYERLGWVRSVDSVFVSEQGVEYRTLSYLAPVEGGFG